MGNKPFTLVIKIDQETCRAGESVTGKVYLDVTSKAPRTVTSATGIRLLLEGVERVKVNLSTEEKAASKSEIASDETSCSLARVDLPLVDYSQRTTGIADRQYEYPFEFRLPSELPSSFCGTHKDRVSCGEIAYTLTAYLTGRDIVGVHQDYMASSPLQVMAAPMIVNRNEPLTLDVENFAIHSCCYNKGNIQMGCKVNKRAVSPKEEVVIEITGENNSQLKIMHIHAQWVETVALKTPKDLRKDCIRVVAEQSLSIDDYDQWIPRHKRRKHSAASQNKLPVVSFTLPQDAKCTHNGMHVQVRHALVISAKTQGGMMTFSPQISTLVKVVPPLPDQPSFPQNPNYVPDYAPKTAVAVPVAPEDWQPQTATSVSIPVATVIIDDCDFASNSKTPMAPVVTPIVAARATAPSEATLSSSISLQQIQDKVTNPQVDPSFLLESVYARLLQGLSPRDLSAILILAGPRAPVVARNIALQMQSNLQTRHVLACMYNLPASDRLGVLLELVPRTSDFEQNRGMVQDVLPASEVQALNAALARLR
jgi:Arrestin (or S-antigen), N-terminal domain/Arrestin (or S-antigen), C-terminal domain